MKNLLMLAALAVAMISLTACSKEEEVGYGGDVKQAPVSATEGAKKGVAANMPTDDPNR